MCVCVFTGVWLDDEGVYICEAQNQFGTVRTEVSVSVTGLGMASISPLPVPLAMATVSVETVGIARGTSGEGEIEAIPSPVTETVTSVLTVPNWFLASQMYTPSSSSQTPVNTHTVS